MLSPAAQLRYTYIACLVLNYFSPQYFGPRTVFSRTYRHLIEVGAVNLRNSKLKKVMNEVTVAYFVCHSICVEIHRRAQLTRP